jgi:hypothetical protein
MRAGFCTRRIRGLQAESPQRVDTERGHAETISDTPDPVRVHISDTLDVREGLHGRSQPFPEGRDLSRKVATLSRKVATFPGRSQPFPEGLLMLPDTLNGLFGASNGRFRTCFGRKTAIRMRFGASHGHDCPEIGHPGDHSTFRESNEPSKSIRDLPKQGIDLPRKVSTFPGRYRWFPEALTTFPRGFERFPGD